jgi:VanZ family protein
MTFVMLSLYRQRTWRGIVNLPVFIFAILLLLPTGLYYFSGILGGSTLQGEAQAQFLPGLLFKSFFWTGWFSQIGKVVGFMPFVGALLGLAIMPRKHPAVFLLIGMWMGYLMMGVLFTYTIFSHDYYQLQLIPIVALCLSALLAPAVQQVAHLYRQPVVRTVLLCLFIVLAASFSVTENRWRAFYRYYENVDRVVAQIGPEIGHVVEHSSKTVVLTGADDGFPLEYYAEISGAIWPSWGDLQGAKLQSNELPPTRQMFDNYRRDMNPEYFIVTSMAELEYQPELKEILNRIPILIQTRYYIIYDLRSQP